MTREWKRQKRFAELIECYAKPGDETVLIPLTRRELAILWDVTAGTVQKYLTHAEEEGLIACRHPLELFVSPVKKLPEPQTEIGGSKPSVQDLVVTDAQLLDLLKRATSEACQEVVAEICAQLWVPAALESALDEVRRKQDAST